MRSKRVIQGSMLLFSLLPSAAGAAEVFTPIVPCRIVDTRTGFGGALTSGVKRNFTVTGGVTVSGFPTCTIPTRASAVSLDVIAVAPTANGFLALWPSSQPTLGASTLNVHAGESALANGSIVALSFIGGDAQAALEPSLSVVYGTATAGTTHVVIDVTGYFSDPSAPFTVSAGPTWSGTLGYTSPNAIKSGVQGQGQYGVEGVGSDVGVIGFSSLGFGIYGEGTSGVAGAGQSFGVEGFAVDVSSNFGETFVGKAGVFGTSSALVGVFGTSDSNSGVIGVSSSSYGVQGHSVSFAGVLGGTDSASGAGVQGVGGRYGVKGTAGTFGLRGSVGSGSTNYGDAFAGSAGVFGDSSATVGVYGTSDSNVGVAGVSNTLYGVYGAGGLYAGYFAGNVHVTGTLSVDGSVSKSGGSFKIDHPLDPENKYLYHSFVESPDMMNVYNGNALLDAEGRAVVELPEWFEALNSDFRYQLTCIGGFAPIYVSAEIADHRFEIAGGRLGLKVSWQVTGIRHDPYAEHHRIPVEEEKSPEERGHYLDPADYAQPPEKGLTPKPLGVEGRPPG